MSSIILIAVHKNGIVWSWKSRVVKLLVSNRTGDWQKESEWIRTTMIAQAPFENILYVPDGAPFIRVVSPWANEP